MPNEPMILGRWLDVLRLRLRSLFRLERVDVELDRELRAHLEHQIDENVAHGMTREDARLAALRAFGAVDQVKEEARDTRGVALIDNLVRDLRYTLRGLPRQPMLLVAATISIALGAGGNIAVFSLAKEFLFAAPHARLPRELVHMDVSHSSHATYQRWLDLKASGALADIAGYSIDKHVNWLNGEAAVSLTPMLVTANFFDVTGPPFALGRGFSADEARAERDPRVVVVSDPFWRRELGSDSTVVGRSIVLNGESYTILGVLARRLRSVAGFGITPNVYVPLNRALVPDIRSPDTRVVTLLGRLKPDQSLAQGRAAVDAVDRRLAGLAGDTLYGGVQEFTRAGYTSGKAGRLVAGFFALLALASLFVLFIACANVAGLLIARATARRQEIAVRLALGATRARLLQQFLVEGFWLALIGSLAGMALSLAFMRVVNGVRLPVDVPIELNLGLDAPVFYCALGLVLLSTVFCALLPALNATRLTLTPALKREEPHYANRRFTPRAVLLTGQVTVSTVLLVTALLFVRNLARTQVTNPGFEVEHAVVARMGFVQGRPGGELTALLDAAVERVSGLPGVASVAYSNAVPLTMQSASSNGRSVRINEQTETQHSEYAQSLVGPAYFSTLGIRLLQGREFQPADRQGAPSVAIVNEEFVRRYFGGRGPIGSILRFVGEETPVPFEVVGVVADSKHLTIGEDQRAAFYLPLLQYAEGIEFAFIQARTHGDPQPLVKAMRQTIGELDRSMAVEVEPLRTKLAFALLPSQISATVLGSLGALGLLLAMFGLYAIVSYSVSRRIAEIAIRGALGASHGRIIRLVMRDAAALVGIGVMLGLGLAALVTQPLARFLVAGLSTTDPLTFVATGAAFALVSLLASWLPARRAVRIDPAIAMRLD